MIVALLTLCLIISKTSGSCVVSYSTHCDTLADLNKLKNAKITNLVIGSLHTVPSETLTVGILKKFPKLEELTIMGTINKLEVEAFMGLDRLLVLKLHKNFIKTVTDFTFVVLPQLSKVDLQNNNIEYINTTRPFIFPNMKTVDLSFNKLHYLKTQVFAAPGLERLIITNNQIVEVSTRDVFNKDLLLLDLDHNKLKTIDVEPFNSLTKLEELILSNNQFSVLWTKGKLQLPALKKLDFSHNQITLMEDHFFSGFPKLQYLYLNHNLIKKLTAEFSKMGLHTLHVHSNQMEDIEMIILNDSTKLREITISNNPLPCNCLDNIFLFMELSGMNTTTCEYEFLTNASYPTCVGISSEWDNGKCTFSVPVDEYLYEHFEMNKNEC